MREEEDARRSWPSGECLPVLIGQADVPAQLPEDMIIFDEALTDSPAIERYRPPTKPEHYFITRGGSLGAGIPGVIGVKLANPDKTAIAFTG